MENDMDTETRSPLLMVAGAKGAVGSTVAAAIAAMGKNQNGLASHLMTAGKFTQLGGLEHMKMVGWDADPRSLSDTVKHHGVLDPLKMQELGPTLDQVSILRPPEDAEDFQSMVQKVAADMARFKEDAPEALPVFVNLLPAAPCHNFSELDDLSQLLETADPIRYPDMVYTVAAVESGIPVVNFTPNELEIPIIERVAVKNGAPMAGCDGKTGQTYFKLVLASALKARCLTVDGWYSLNILGNADGHNLMDPERAACKVANKTDILDNILEYPVGNTYDESTHKVRIDYYPPRGDAKEAWDVIDIKGLFEMPMSIRLNLQGRDSILAAPLVIDLARWAAVLKLAGRSGMIPELAFYFKKPTGENAPLTFQDQIRTLQKLEAVCEARL
jgi:myo-inositol-1-phosphate synthase